MFSCLCSTSRRQLIDDGNAGNDNDHSGMFFFLYSEALNSEEVFCIILAEEMQWGRISFFVCPKRGGGRKFARHASGAVNNGSREKCARLSHSLPWHSFSHSLPWHSFLALFWKRAWSFMQTRRTCCTFALPLSALLPLLHWVNITHAFKIDRR